MFFGAAERPGYSKMAGHFERQGAMGSLGLTRSGEVDNFHGEGRQTPGTRWIMPPGPESGTGNVAGLG